MIFRRRNVPRAREWPADLASRHAAALGKLAEPWRTDLRTALEELPTADPLYAPTSFWAPGVDAIMADIRDHGLDEFKSWSSAAFFFYPRYGPVFTNAMIEAVMPTLQDVAPKYPAALLRAHLVGSTEANRDIDIVLAQLDRDVFPIDITTQGEDPIGRPPQQYRPFGADGPTFGKPHLNYLKILSALSRLLPRPVRSVIEIGGGFGALGEILMKADPKIQYVDVDIPPLATVAHHYLSRCFPSRPLVSNSDLHGDGELSIEPGGRSGCVLAWQTPQITGTADLFVNTFSFQEMEPDVVVNYASQIARLETQTVASMNSRRGKPLVKDGGVGVREQVTSDFIASTFEDVGYEVVARVGRPTAPPQAELVVLRRT